MKRNLIQRLVQWRNSPGRKPFLLSGRKGVGKTYLACDFAKSFFEDYLYINFETHPDMKERLFHNKSLSLGQSICQYFELPEELLNSVPVILDEITFCPDLIRLLAQESGLLNGYYLLLTSYERDLPPELKLSPPVESAVLSGLEFDEFLVAVGSDWYIDVIRGHYMAGKKVPEIVHAELLGLFNDYLSIGGMPAAVNEYLSMESDVNVPEQHRLIFNSYYTEIGRRYPEKEALKMHQVYEAAAAQLQKENHKFQYRIIRKGATSTLYRDAITTLTEDGYLICCEKEGEPSQVRLYYPDTGMLHSLIPSYVREQENTRKALIENYVMNSLILHGYCPYFWESSSLAKIDFLIRKEGSVIPIEVRPGENTRTKSIEVYRKDHSFPYSIKISQRNYETGADIRYIPYYAVFCL